MSSPKSTPPTRREFARTAATTALGIAAAMMLPDNSPAAETVDLFPVTVAVDANAPTVGPLTPFWRFFGADEPNYATLPDGKRLLTALGHLGETPSPGYFRTHNLLTTGDGKPALKWGSTNAYTEDKDGKPVYDWTIVDQIIDTYRLSGLRPYLQIGFMPEALSVSPVPYRHHWHPGAKYEEIYTGWAFPPKDYAKWEELAFRWTAHNVEKYGRAEVEQWFFQVWNEPNIGYWRGTPDEFHRLHDHAIAGVRRALPTARVGGPDTAGDGGKFMDDFLEHCLRGTNHATGKPGTPLDFVSFHAKGSPTFQDGHVRMGIKNQLTTIDKAFARFASHPELKHTPLVIGESDPDGCAACQGPQLGYRNGTLYSSYTAASFARKYALADRHGVNLQGAVTWAFEFENEPLFAGFRVLATGGGIDLPVLNVFRLFEKMAQTGSERIAAVSSGEVPLDTVLASGVRGSVPDIGAFAVRDKDRKRVAVLLWHYHDDDLPGPDAQITLSVSGLPPGPTVRTAGLPLPPPLRVTEYRIDQTHGNAYAAWQRMGSPPAPTDAQMVALREAAHITPPKAAVDSFATSLGVLPLALTLPRQAVSLVVIDASGHA